MLKSALKDLIRTYQPDSGERAGVIAEFDELLALDGDVLDRNHFVPGHITASALVMSPDRRHVALVYHRKLQRWLQPGGHVEPADADVVAAARREIIEECGPLELSPLGLVDLDVHAIPSFGTEPGHLHYDVRIAFEGVGPVEATAEVADAGWFPLDDAPADIDESVQRLLRKARRIG